MRLVGIGATQEAGAEVDVGLGNADACAAFAATCTPFRYRTVPLPADEVGSGPLACELNPDPVPFSSKFESTSGCGTGVSSTKISGSELASTPSPARTVQ